MFKWILSKSLTNNTDQFQPIREDFQIQVGHIIQWNKFDYSADMNGIFIQHLQIEKLWRLCKNKLGSSYTTH